MKKALVLLLALSMVFGAFADEPVANVNVSEFKGEASVQWGVDLDSGKTGFKNDAKVTMKLNLIDGGDKASTGEGIWGEIKIKTDGDTFTKVEGNDKEFGALEIPAKIKVDTAKLHFGDNVYIGITSGDTTVGEYKLDTAVAAEQIKNGNVGDDSYKNGITAGYANDMFSVDVDFRSADLSDPEKRTVYAMVIDINKDDGKVVLANGAEKELKDIRLNGQKVTDIEDVKVGYFISYSEKSGAQYSNAYSLAIDGSVKLFDENLTLKGGYSADFRNPEDEVLETGFYVATDYKLGLNDTFYLKPQVGYVHSTSNKLDANDKATVTNDGYLVAALLFGWDEKADDKPGVYFLDKDSSGRNAKKVVPGISVAMSKQVVGTGKYDGEITYKGVKSPTELSVSFFSGKIVKNLTAAAYYSTYFGEQLVENKDGDKITSESFEIDDVPFEFAAGLKYKLSVGEGSITPQFGIAMAKNAWAGVTKVINYNNYTYDADNEDLEVLNIKAGAEFKGYVENTTFSVEYASKNLKNEDSTGTLNFKCKIAL